jgi:hypothetical protein
MGLICTPARNAWEKQLQIPLPALTQRRLRFLQSASTFSTGTYLAQETHRRKLPMPLNRQDGARKRSGLHAEKGKAGDVRLCRQATAEIVSMRCPGTVPATCHPGPVAAGSAGTPAGRFADRTGDLGRSLQQLERSCVN